MASFYALFIDARDGVEVALEDLRSALRRDSSLRCFSEAQYGESEPWIVLAASIESQFDSARCLSSATGRRVLCLSIQTVVDAFSFGAFEPGKQPRLLVFGCDGPEERTWEKVSGPPEPWEAEGLFRASQSIQDITDDLDYLDPKVVQRIYGSREFVLGEDLPVIGSNAWGIGEAVHEHYDLPRTYTYSTRVGPVWPLRLFTLFW